VIAVVKSQMTLNHTLEFESDAQTTGPLSERNPATGFATLSHLLISNSANEILTRYLAGCDSRDDVEIPLRIDCADQEVGTTKS
jgi:hypothetical protein